VTRLQRYAENPARRRLGSSQLRRPVTPRIETHENTADYHKRTRECDSKAHKTKEILLRKFTNFEKLPQIYTSVPTARLGFDVKYTDTGKHYE